MARIRVRRPLIALVVLLVAIVVGYAVRAATHDDDRSPGPSTPASLQTDAFPHATFAVPSASLR